MLRGKIQSYHKTKKMAIFSLIFYFNVNFASIAKKLNFLLVSLTFGLQNILENWKVSFSPGLEGLVPAKPANFKKFTGY